LPTAVPAVDNFIRLINLRSKTKPTRASFTLILRLENTGWRFFEVVSSDLIDPLPDGVLARAWDVHPTCLTWGRK
jgi:hypothetical protein